jgi:HSP20 family protein
MHRHLGALMGGQPFHGQGTWSPPMDVYRTGDNVIVRVELPGVQPSSIHLDFTGPSLRLSGERREQCAQEKEGYYLMEIDYGPFFREIPLPGGVRGDRISAEYEDGFLIITIPLSQDGPREGVEISVK